jgi:hypothetical protein
MARRVQWERRGRGGWCGGVGVVVVVVGVGVVVQRASVQVDA